MIPKEEVIGHYLEWDESQNQMSFHDHVQAHYEYVVADVLKKDASNYRNNHNYPVGLL
jgi:hypothetical protein